MNELIVYYIKQNTTKNKTRYIYKCKLKAAKRTILTFKTVAVIMS